VIGCYSNLKEDDRTRWDEQVLNSRREAMLDKALDAALEVGGGITGCGWLASVRASCGTVKAVLALVLRQVVVS
jgi:hypothetical protein